MTLDEMNALVEKYFTKEEYRFPGHFEHRFDPISSAQLYSMLRKYKPTNVLAIGTWLGGSTCLMMAALLKNKKKFSYVASELEDDLRRKTEENCFQHCGRAPIMIGDITENLDKISDDIDFLFHDTNHDRETTKWIHENIFRYVKKGALVVMHDWAVEELPDGTWKGKDGMWPETKYWIEQQNAGTLGLKKLFWSWKNPGECETAFWEKL